LFASYAVEYVGTPGCTLGAPVYGPAFLSKPSFTSKVLILKFEVNWSRGMFSGFLSLLQNWQMGPPRMRQ